MVRQRKPDSSIQEAETRYLASVARLRQLERDQAVAMVDLFGSTNDVLVSSDESDAEKRTLKRKSSTSRRSKASIVHSDDIFDVPGIRRNRKPVDMLLASEPADGDVDTFLSVEAPAASQYPGSHPGWKLCSVCSEFADYKCVRCRATFCSMPCFSTHRETKCLRFPV